MKYEIIKLGERYYPEKLKKIYAPPQELYIIGDKSILNNKSIAIIGCRKCSEYGRNMAEKFGYELSRRKIVIISGLARGIDTCSHIGAIKANGKTIAVLGSGLDNIYPPENIKICDEIIKKRRSNNYRISIRNKTI